MDFGNVYFLGIGGIGMSAIARYFLHEGKHVGGYDRTGTPLTKRLADEGADIHYEDDPALIGDGFRDPATTLVVYTPALPDDHHELAWFRNHGFEVLKRSEILGHLARGKYVMAVAGTHGKTTTTTMAAWFNHVAGGGGSAFLGGISKNFDSNLVLGKGDRFAVEADEFDRSFLKLFPDVAVVTSADADHLDIYGNHDEMRRTFSQFISQIKKGGALIIKAGVDLDINNPGITVYRYDLEDGNADFHTRDLTVNPDGTYTFDIVCPGMVIGGCTLGIPGRINVENALAAVAMLWVAALKESAVPASGGTVTDTLNDAKVREALATFKGVRRRFDFHINTPGLTYMDDYAHHPEELRAAISSIKEMFPGRRLTAVFQPHLYTRTRDFYRQFAEALSQADEVILLPIYPAREEPIEGVSSEMIAALLTVPHRIVPLERIAQEVEMSNIDILVTFGAGNIENQCGEIARRLETKVKK